MPLTLTVDTSSATSWLNDVANEQIPFAASKALNATAVDFQAAQFAHEQSIFHLNRPDWVKRSTKITHFAKKTALWATIAVSPPGGDRRADVIAKFEEDTEKTSVAGHDIAVPIGARRNKANIVRSGDRPKSFNFHQVGNAVRGDRGTFIVTTAGGRRLILQRTRSGVNALYLLTPRVVIRPDLDFEPTAVRTVDDRWLANFDRWFEEAMRTAR